MKRDHEMPVKDVGLEGVRVISYSQLKRILQTFDWESLNRINASYMGKEVQKEDTHWKAVDGKELRGTIDKALGQKRSENVIQLVSHKGREAETVGFYNGSKESEKTAVGNYVKACNDLSGIGVSMDALHTESGLLSGISDKGGIYLAQVKGNQPKLLQECRYTHEQVPVRHRFETVDKGHGRVEKRTALLYHFNEESLEPRWYGSGVKTLIVVDRETYNLKKGKRSQETAFYMTNRPLNQKSAPEVFHATREHWGIESNNGVRDNNFGEDHILSFHANMARTMAVFITWALNLLRRNNKENNISALREEIADDRSWLYTLLKTD